MARFRVPIDQPEVPIDAERLLAWITKPDRLEVVLDIFDVGFRRRVQRDGIASARRWYWWQVIRTLVDSVIQVSPRLAGFIYLLRRIVTLFIGY